jgi:DNA-binding NarL/FixJ family response regulator
MPINPKPLCLADDSIIFVVEGDEVVRSALHFILDDHNETHSFAHLDQALANAAGRTPSIILLGIGAVRHDGERTLAEIAIRLPNTRVLIVANSENDPLALASLKRGAHGVIGKPITFDSVRGKVDALLMRHERPTAMLGLLPLSAAW